MGANNLCSSVTSARTTTYHSHNKVTGHNIFIILEFYEKGTNFLSWLYT